MSDNVDSIIFKSGMAGNAKVDVEIAAPFSHRSKVISTSGSSAAILNFSSGTMSGEVRRDII